EMIGYERFVREEQPRLRAEGRRVGLGLAAYVEGTGIGPYEGARVTVEATGKVSVATGVGTQGQGHATTFAQIVADALGVDVRDVRVVTGDTAEFHWGAGTWRPAPSPVWRPPPTSVPRAARPPAASTPCSSRSIRRRCGSRSRVTWSCTTAAGS